MTKHQHELNNVLPRINVIVLAFGVMIGWGWVVLSGDWIHKAGSLGSIVAFLFGGLLVIFVGLVYAELTTSMPKAGEEHHFALFMGILVTLSPLLGRPALVWLVDAGGLSVVSTYFIVALSFLVLRKTQPELERPFRAGKSNIVWILALILSIGFVFLYMPGMPASLV